ncbi:hypothetical protein GCM10009827_013860 [Dactylosporangium maewongense]|uniref:Uncharacterized protein n=2 Tax=Micromonosporaceae TaxID=28056 RepID=A0ABN1ZR10_9ACTN
MTRFGSDDMAAFVVEVDLLMALARPGPEHRGLMHLPDANDASRPYEFIARAIREHMGTIECVR